jgi:protein-L-isoaspartate(D-aspartate) O-methyltransferase
MDSEANYPDKLVNILALNNPGLSPAIREAFRTTPRHVFIGDSFVPGADKDGITTWTHQVLDLDSVYQDEAIVVQVRDNWPSVSCSSPSVIASMLEDLDLSPGMKVLEVGTGTGWTTALIAYLIGETGSVISIEIDSTFATKAKDTLKELGVENVRVIHGDGVYGYPEQVPYDRIIVHAGISWLPVAWQEQLKPDGLLLAIKESVNSQQMLLLHNTGTGLQGRATRYAYFGGIKAGEDDVRTGSLLDPSSFRFPDLDSLPLVGEAEGLFPLAETPDFLFYLNLQQPPLQLQLFMLYPEGAPSSNPVPVIVDAGSHDVLAGRDSGYERAYGSARLLKLLNRESRRWRELGCPQLADYLFTAVPLTHNSHTGARHLPLNVPGELYFAPSQLAGYLDWVIRLAE